MAEASMPGLPKFVDGKLATELTCRQCGTSMVMLDEVILGRCPNCQVLVWRRPEIIATTTSEIPGYQISAVLDVVTAERAIGMNSLKDLFVEFRDMVGGRSGTTENTLRELRQQCLQALKAEAKRLGANAIVGIDLDYSEFTGKGMTMLFLVASGTAVYATPIQANPKSNQ